MPVRNLALAVIDGFSGRVKTSLVTTADSSRDRLQLLCASSADYQNSEILRIARIAFAAKWW
jgi:hypothetical protein